MIDIEAQFHKYHVCIFSRDKRIEPFNRHILFGCNTFVHLRIFDFGLPHQPQSTNEFCKKSGDI